MQCNAYMLCKRAKLDLTFQQEKLAKEHLITIGGKDRFCVFILLGVLAIQHSPHAVHVVT